MENFFQIKLFKVADLNSKELEVTLKIMKNTWKFVKKTWSNPRILSVGKCGSLNTFLM